MAIDVNTGKMLAGKYVQSTENDGPNLSSLLTSVGSKILAVCGEMADDSLVIRQLIPPMRKAIVANNNKQVRRYRALLKEGDEVINDINYNTID